MGSYSKEFKRETAELVLDKGYTQKDACEAMGVSKSAISRWVCQIKSELIQMMRVARLKQLIQVT